MIKELWKTTILEDHIDLHNESLKYSMMIIEMGLTNTIYLTQKDADHFKKLSSLKKEEEKIRAEVSFITQNNQKIFKSFLGFKIIGSHKLPLEIKVDKVKRAFNYYEELENF